jgi:hypothetical protein
MQANTATIAVISKAFILQSLADHNLELWIEFEPKIKERRVVCYVT